MNLGMPRQRVWFTSPMGRGRIALAIRVRGYSLTIDRNPSPQPSPTEVGYIRLRQIKMANSGKPELDGRGSAPPLTKWLGQYFRMKRSTPRKLLRRLARFVHALAETLDQPQHPR